MTLEEYIKLFNKNGAAMIQFMTSDAPRKAGGKAIAFFKSNFRNGGYMDNGFHAWPITKRQMNGGKGAESRYLPLHSRRNYLFDETTYDAGPGYVLIKNDVPYAKIHNDGGTTHPNVTKKMKKFFWAMYYKNGGGKKHRKNATATVAEKYKWMALTKKKQLEINIPQRKFIYSSREVKQLVKDVVDEGIRKIFKE